MILARSLGDTSIERKEDEIALSKHTVARHTKELSDGVSQQLKDLVKTCTFLSLALDESTDICDVVQLNIFIQGMDDNFSAIEDVLSLESLHGRTRGSVIFDKVKSCLEN